MPLNEREDLGRKRKPSETGVHNVCTAYNDRVLRDRDSENRP